MSKGLGSLLFRLGADIKDFQTGLKSAERELQSFQYKAQKIGRDLTTSITLPLAAIGAKSVIAFDKQAKAIAQVEAGIASTGGAAGVTSEAVQKMAAELQKISTYGDEDIMRSVSAQLLTFTNITQTEFPRAQKAILDVASRLDMDLKSAAIQVGKALNDPIQGLTALSRAGVQFTDSQKEVIRSLVETGRMSEAQQVILGELEKQFGGSAEAMTAGLGSVKQAWNAIGDASESVGKLLIPYLEKMAVRVQGLAETFSNLSERTQKFIVVTGAIAASIGPGLLAINQLIKVKKALITTISLLRASFIKLTAVMLANPITAIAVALAAAAGALFLFKKRSDDATESQEGLYKSIEEVNSALATNTWQQYGTAATRAADGTWVFSNNLDKLRENIKSFTKNELEGLKNFLEGEYSRVNREAANVTSDFNKSILNNYLDDYQAALDIVNGELSKFSTNTKEANKSNVESLGIIGALTEKIKLLNDEKRNSESERRIAEINGEIVALEKQRDFYESLTTSYLNFVEKIKANPIPKMEGANIKLGLNIDPGALLPLVRGNQAAVEQIRSDWATLQEHATELSNHLQGTFEGLAYVAADAFGQMISGQMSFAEGLTRIVGFVGDAMQQLGRLFVAQGIAASAFLKSLSNPATAIGAGFALIATGAAVKGFMAKKLEIPGMIEGGIVPQGFPNDTYLARLTSGEVVVPPGKLDSLGVNSKAYPDHLTVTFKGKVAGQDMLFITEKAQYSRKRNTGR